MRTLWIIGAAVAVAAAILAVLLLVPERATTPEPSPSVAAAVTPPAAAAVSNEIPPAFRGEWNTSPADCGTGSSDSRLTIAAKTVAFYESTGMVKRVTVQSGRTIKVEGSYAGEGETFERTDAMTLSASGNDLTIDGFTRHKCP